jgi:hypothetical protein
MSSSTKREVSHDQREIRPRQRRSSRLNRKRTDNHNRKLSILTLTKKVKSSSYTEKTKLETLYSPDTGSSKVMKSHEYSDDCEIPYNMNQKQYFI